MFLIFFLYISYFSLGSTSVSDTESVNDEAINPTARLRVYTSTHLHRNLIEDRIHIKKSLGRKKLRRYQDSKLCSYTYILM